MKFTDRSWRQAGKPCQPTAAKQGIVMPAASPPAIEPTTFGRTQAVDAVRLFYPIDNTTQEFCRQAGGLDGNAGLVVVGR